MSSSHPSSVPRILFTSLSRKVSLFEAVLNQARSYHPEAELVGGDCDPDCAGRARVEQFVETPPLDEISKEDFVAFCQAGGFTHVIPTRDGELAYFAEALPVLREHGLDAMVSPPTAVEACLDKMLFANKVAKLGFPAIPAFEDPGPLDENRATVKERRGQSSRQIHLDLTKEEAVERAGSLQDPIFQPHIVGRELSADLYVDREGRAHGPILRWRDLVVDGESKVTTTFRKAEWERDLGELASLIGLRGHGLAQAIVDKELQLHILEINPRLGGASPLSLACGLKSIEWFLQESAGNDLGEPTDFDYPAGMRLTRDEEGRDEVKSVEE